MAKVKKRPKRASTPRPRQEFIPGMEPVKNDKVHKRALIYAEKRDERIAWNKQEKEAHDELLAVMIEEGLEIYEYGDLRVHVDSKRKCKVEIGGKHESNGEAED